MDGLVRTALRLENWSHWASGGYPRCCLVCYEAQAGAEPDHRDAELIEACLLAMRRERRQYWRLIRARYLYRWSELTQCQALKFGPEKLRERHVRALKWLTRRLENRENGQLFPRQVLVSTDTYLPS